MVLYVDSPTGLRSSGAPLLNPLDLTGSSDV
jgi:hypothetical protein